jgi:hypothetical protein
MISIKKFLERSLKLKVKQAKSVLARFWKPTYDGLGGRRGQLLLVPNHKKRRFLKRCGLETNVL